MKLPTGSFTEDTQCRLFLAGRVKINDTGKGRQSLAFLCAFAVAISNKHIV